MESSSVRVRNAATVVIIRPGSAKRDPQSGSDSLSMELYMLKRSARSPFLPDTMVFPGGVVDEKDIAPGDTLGDAASYCTAACRETFEECNLVLDPLSLRWFDTWKTPEGESSRRFSARFFVTMIAAGTGDEARPDGHETTAGFWGSPARFLDLWRKSALDLPIPTLCVLLALDRDPDRVLRSPPADDLEVPILPRIRSAPSSHRFGAVGTTVVLPHDPVYADLPGEPSLIPERARAYPSRFVREQNRWQPC